MSVYICTHDENRNDENRNRFLSFQNKRRKDSQSDTPSERERISKKRRKDSRSDTASGPGKIGEKCDIYIYEKQQEFIDQVKREKK
jgi:hypothetical protein